MSEKSQVVVEEAPPPPKRTHHDLFRELGVAEGQLPEATRQALALAARNRQREGGRK